MGRVIKLHQLSGYSVIIAEDEPTNGSPPRLTVVVTQLVSDRMWKGTCDTVEEAIGLAAKIVAEQTLRGLDELKGDKT